jgi:hypothetical protein
VLVIDMQLWSGITGAKTSLGLVIIDNIKTTSDGKRADYRVRAWAKGTTIDKIKAGAKPIREGYVMNHARLTKPVWNLMMKALAALGYDL